MQRVNLQLAEKRVVRTDGALEVVDVFPTIQGEGPFAGLPAVFVRTASCNLTCPSCDTDYTSNRRLWPLADLMAEVGRLAPPGWGPDRCLVVLTGGEPFRQATGALVAELHSQNYLVQVETNGTLYDDSLGVSELRRLSIVCSPKTAGVNAALAQHIGYLKYILRAGEVDGADGLPTSSLNYGVRPVRPWPGFTGEVYIQPLDEQDPAANKANQDAAVASCLKFGYTLCLQLHKLVGLP